MICLVTCFNAVCAQKKVQFDAVLDLAYSFSINENKYNSLIIGGTAGVLLFNDWFFIGGGGKLSYDKYEFPLINGKYGQGTVYGDARLYIPVHELASVYLDYKLGASGADPKIQEEKSESITTYKDFILGGPYRSLGAGLRIISEDGKDVGIGISYDYNELVLKHKTKPVLGIGLVENLTIKLEYYY